jgi:hypothetical protein
MPPAFNLSQDQTLQFKFDLFNRNAIVAKPSLPHYEQKARIRSSLKVIAKVEN